MTVGLLSAPEKTLVIVEKSVTLPIDILMNEKRRTPMKACPPKIKLLGYLANRDTTYYKDTLHSKYKFFKRVPCTDPGI